MLVDIDGDGQVEIVKSVDNYAGDEAHDAVYAFETDGKLLWKVAGLSCEDSPNVADLDGDGQVEIVGMTFGGEVFCLDGKGELAVETGPAAGSWTDSFTRLHDTQSSVMLTAKRAWKSWP